MDHKMAKQKFLTKKYIKNLLSEILYQETTIRPNNISIWPEYLSEAFTVGHFILVEISSVFEELENQIKSDFGIKDEISIFYNTNNDLKNDLYWDYDSKIKTSFNELIKIIYKDIQNELNLPIKDKSYFLNKFKDKVAEPIFGIIYLPLAIIFFVLFLIIFIKGPSNTFVDIFDLDQIYGDIFGWALIFFFIYLFERYSRKK